MSRSLFRALTISVATLALAACASTGDGVSNDGKINSALERAADQAGREGASAGSLVLLEKLYKREPKNETTAMKYARALRNNGETQKALQVLEPFASKGSAGADTLTEFAAIQIGLARYPQAESYARKAIEKDDDNDLAYQLLGISLDAQMKYKDAESAFRKALSMWKGDPIPVMNNLALNLTNQERLPEALDIMQQAKEAAPNRPEVERNLRIIRTLNETASGRPAPKPGEKPAARTLSADELEGSANIAPEPESVTAAPLDDKKKPAAATKPADKAKKANDKPAAAKTAP